MSAVYLARDPVLSRLAAIKVLHPDLLYQPAVLDRFFKEAKTVSRVSSPNVVQVFDFGTEGQLPFLVLEFVDGQTLGKLIDQLGEEPMDPVVAAALMAQVAEGLSVTAEAGIVHRDLKPDNLLLNRKGLVKISDFGICHLKDHTMTATGQVLGSPRFMSPEQVRGVKPLSAQSDLFSLGAVFYSLLAGRPPFMAESLPELYRQIVEEPHPSLGEIRPGLDRDLVRLVDKLLQKVPGKRGDGPREACNNLRKFLHKKKALDPVARIAAYIQQLNEAGVQTTSNLSPEQVRMWMGSIDLGRPVRRRKFSRAAIYTGAATLLLGIGLIGTYSVLTTNHSPKENGNTSPASAEKDKVHPLGDVSVRIQRDTVENPSQSHPASIVSEPPRTIPASETSKQDVQSSSHDQAILSIQTSPPIAEVLLDERVIGKTPMEGKLLSVGTHRLTLRSKFGKEIDTNMALRPGPQTLRVVFLENPESPDSEPEP